MSAEGNERAALAALASASRMMAQVRGDLSAAGRDDASIPLLSDEEAELLAEYTRLQRERASTAGPGDRSAYDRLREIERELYGIQEIYAAIFLQVYRDPEMGCAIPAQERRRGRA